MAIKMSQKINKPKNKAILALILVFTPAIILVFFSSIGCEHKFQKLDDFGEIKPFTFIDADNNTRTSSEFKNDIVLINYSRRMIYLRASNTAQNIDFIS